ncbi:MAG: hypothetical protein H6896_11245 [Rhodovulum sp.]|nr:hypothetical protein [Rhodovulum sp.]
MLFLVSGWLAFIETCHAHWAWRPHSLSWDITAINLLGCIAFMVSAVFGYVPRPGAAFDPATLSTGFHRPRRARLPDRRHPPPAGGCRGLILATLAVNFVPPGAGVPSPIDCCRSGRVGLCRGRRASAPSSAATRPDPQPTATLHPPRPAAHASGRPDRATRHRRLASSARGHALRAARGAAFSRSGRRGVGQANGPSLRRHSAP